MPASLEIKSDTRPGALPSLAAPGEIAINRADGRFFYRDEAGNRAGGLLPDLDASGYLKFRNGLTLGRYQGGKFISQPDAVQVQSADPTGDVSVSTPDGGVRGLAYTRTRTAPSGFSMLRNDLDDEERFVDEFGPVDTPAATSATFTRAFAFYKARGGGRLKLRHRIYELATTVRVDFGNFEMIGTGGLRFPFPNTSDPNQFGTVIRWAGASGGTALVVAPTAGPTARPLARCRACASPASG